MDVTTYVLLKQRLGGKADLIDGKIPAEELPSYVDDVIEYEDLEHFPATGEGSKIYVALDTGFTYRWSGSDYIQIGGQDLSDYYTKDETDAELETKQDTIEDLTTIRSGAEAGSTAVQPEDSLTDAEIEAAWAIPPLPTKGGIINMNLDGTARNYRVLDINEDGVAEVLTMSDVSQHILNTEDAVVTFSDGFYGQKYQDSELDTYLNTTWYNSLTTAAKSAIVAKDIIQDFWKYINPGSPVYCRTSRDGQAKDPAYGLQGTYPIGSRKIYILSISDIARYLGLSSGGTITWQALSQMFWGNEDSHDGEALWLRSAYASYTSGLCSIWGETCCFSSCGHDEPWGVRPVFNINLNKVDYTPVVEE